MNQSASPLTVWRPKQGDLPHTMAPETRAAIEVELIEHFEAFEGLLERLGHRPFGRLELRMTGNSFDSEVIYRWDRHR